MTEKPSDAATFSRQQYATADKFKARIYLHANFSTNKYPWPLWVFDQIHAGDHANVLELGCGNGLLWMANAGRIPAHWNITLSDYSEGMLDATRKSLEQVSHDFTYEAIDAHSIHYPDHTFDTVIANHMLYHLSDRPKGLSEIARILKPGGSFYATTIGSNNMLEMKQLMRQFDPDTNYDRVLGSIEANFSLDNGQAQLERYFDSVEVRYYEDGLVVTEADAIVNYVLSCNGLQDDEIVLAPDRAEEFRSFVAAVMEETGSIRITKESGIFVGRSVLENSPL